MKKPRRWASSRAVQNPFGGAGAWLQGPLNAPDYKFIYFQSPDTGSFNRQSPNSEITNRQSTNCECA
jgi:hypothetical protein